jgi:hypothetical protein
MIDLKREAVTNRQIDKQTHTHTHTHRATAAPIEDMSLFVELLFKNIDSYYISKHLKKLLLGTYKNV